MVRILFILLLLGLASCKSALAQGIGSVKTEQYQAEFEKKQSIEAVADYDGSIQIPIQILKIGINEELYEMYPELKDKRVGLGVTNIVLEYLEYTNRFTFTNSVNDFIILNQSSTCQNLLGLSTNDLYNGSVGKSLTLPFQINLAQNQMIKIATNFNAGSVSNLNNNDMKILCSFPVNSPPYSLINYTNNDNYKIDLNNNTFSSINIKLLNQDETPLVLNNQFFSLTLKLDFVNFVGY